MNQPSLYLGVESVKDDLYFKETIQKVIRTRERVKEEMKQLGFSFTDSVSNFIFATHPLFSAREIQAELRKHDIYVRRFDLPRIDNYLRISIGTEEEMNTFLLRVAEFMKSVK